VCFLSVDYFQLFTSALKRDTLVRMNDSIDVIYGKHAVQEALITRPDIVREVHLVDDEDHREFFALIKKSNLVARELNPKKLPKGVPHDAVHQGIVAIIDISKLVLTFDDFISGLNITEDTAIALLGELQDPHNVGAIIRSAAAFGLRGVLIPEHRQAPINGTVIKVSAGMAFRIPLVSIGNVNQTIKDLKEKGFWIYGLDEEATQSISHEGFEKPSAFVVGNEGSGIRLKTLEHCDIPLKIEMALGAESLNASVASAIVFHAWSMKHPFAIK